MNRKVKLVTGAEMPTLGFGTYQSTPKPDALHVGVSIKIAINTGYRLIDCAHAYDNEYLIGPALREMFDQGVVKREELFITSKVWPTYHQTPELIRESCTTSLKNLQLDYLDLLLIHWPTGVKPGTGVFIDDDDHSELYKDSKIDYVDTWKTFEQFVDEGICKNIGVSNFNIKQLERLRSVARHPIAVNQVELHPYLPQKKLVDYCKSHNIALTAYSPFCAPGRGWLTDDTKPGLLQDPAVLAIAAKHKKTAGQVLLRYHIQRDIVVIPKSSNEKRIKENFEVFDFDLSGEELTKLGGMNKNYRSYLLFKGHPMYPFDDDEE